MSRITGETIVVDGTVRHRLSVHVPGGVEGADLLEIFRASLIGSPYTLVAIQVGTTTEPIQIHRLVPRSELARVAAPVLGLAARPAGETSRTTEPATGLGEPTP